MSDRKTMVDTLISGAKIVTMDRDRRVFDNGAIAISGREISAVGPSTEICGKFESSLHVDGSRFVITPGLINGHIHVTGDPLTRAWLPDNIETDFADELTRWVLPRFNAHEPDDEAVSAELAAVKMLRTGTTCFLEAGTVRFLDRVVEGTVTTGIRARVGSWVEGRDFAGDADQTKLIDAAISSLEAEVAAYPSASGERVAAWPILVGHSTNPDEVWLAAKQIADSNGLGVSAHMSPYESDPEWFLAEYGRRPVEHLEDIGVLGNNVCLTHVAHIDDSELRLLAKSETNAVLCPLAALRGAFGISTFGRFPEMAAAGINVMLGTDGFDMDLMRQMHIASGLYKDARRDTAVFPAEETFAMLTCNGAKGLGLEEKIGSLEPGKLADIVCHDTDRPEWQPMLGVLNQLAWLTDGRSVHSVWVDGVRVVDNYRATLVDEQALFERARRASKAVIERSKLPFVSPWPIC